MDTALDGGERRVSNKGAYTPTTEENQAARNASYDRVTLMAWRADNNLNIWTGEPLTPEDMVCNDDGIDDE